MQIKPCNTMDLIERCYEINLPCIEPKIFATARSTLIRENGTHRKISIPKFMFINVDNRRGLIVLIHTKLTIDSFRNENSQQIKKFSPQETLLVFET